VDALAHICSQNGYYSPNNDIADEVAGVISRRGGVGRCALAGIVI
jgi:hypothetical protein